MEADPLQITVTIDIVHENMVLKERITALEHVIALLTDFDLPIMERSLQGRIDRPTANDIRSLDGHLVMVHWLPEKSQLNDLIDRPGYMHASPDESYGWTVGDGHTRCNYDIAVSWIDYIEVLS